LEAPLLPLLSLFVFTALADEPERPTEVPEPARAPGPIEAVPETVAEPEVPKFSLLDAVIRTAQAVPTLNAQTCVPVLETWYSTLEGLDPTMVDMDSTAQAAPMLLDGVWTMRMSLQERIVTLTADDTLTDECLRSIRRVDGANRYLTDHLYELLPEDQRNDGLQVNPAVDFENWHQGIRSGDILVTRGTVLSSAGIAHMGRIDAQFSHNVLTYRPDPDGHVLTVEAYMEWGAITQTLHDVLEHQVGRVVVLRYNDEQFAGEAAAKAWDRIENGPKVHYDGAFEYDEHSRLFCSEVPAWAWKTAGGPTDIPSRLTVFEVEKNAGLYRQMGIDADITSAPADILYDPRFTIVAEWRDVAMLRTMRRHDATVEALMTWMEELDYELKPGPAERNMIGFGLFVRRIPLLGLALKNSLHPKSSRKFLVTGLALNNAADGVYAEFDKRLEGREGIVTWTEMREILEQIRVDDLAVWNESPKDSKFHRTMHPR